MALSALAYAEVSAVAPSRQHETEPEPLPKVKLAETPVVPEMLLILLMSCDRTVSEPFTEM